MKIVCLLLFFGMSITFSSFSQSLMVPVPSTIQIGAYLHGLINPRDHTNPGISGLVAIDYNVFFSTDQYFDRNGNKVIGIDLPNNLGSIPLEVYLSEYLNHQTIH